MNKVLFGLYGDIIGLVDVETTKKARKAAIREGCTTILVATLTDELRHKWENQIPVEISDFKDVEF